MDSAAEIRKVQVHGKSFIVTIPMSLVRELGIEGNDSLAFTADAGRGIFERVSSGNRTNPDKADKYERALDKMMADNDKKDKELSKAEILEKLRIK